MGILSGLFHSRDKPKDSTNGNSYRFLFGGTTSGNRVTEQSAMQMTAVYACVRILSEAIAGLPVHLYHYAVATVIKTVMNAIKTVFTTVSIPRRKGSGEP